ncbi:hypothetical protein [Micromonospora sp. NBC_01796]|uniref:hypothetical protein n=1 Tax=Micromonospora sp. NBC_01796 TaxID=2975987 RepID=UPI002DDC240B|nr:hypothetical protein [Micromonospora sp. NBC_01796]WSA83820.1 hypothetical protein OIE47_26055 [Micromonospora sp. NBC_01796]
MTDGLLDYLPGSGIHVVVLRAPADHAVPVEGKTTFDLDRSEEPSAQLLSELLGSTVRVTTAEGIPYDVLAVLEGIAVPPAFRASPWLADSRPILVQDDGTGQIGDLPVRYSADRGLQILYPQQQPEPDDSDGDDGNG